MGLALLISLEGFVVLTMFLMFYFNLLELYHNGLLAWGVALSCLAIITVFAFSKLAMMDWLR